MQYVNLMHICSCVRKLNIRTKSKNNKKYSRVCVLNEGAHTKHWVSVPISGPNNALINSER